MNKFDLQKYIPLLDKIYRGKSIASKEVKELHLVFKTKQELTEALAGSKYLEQLLEKIKLVIIKDMSNKLTRKYSEIEQFEKYQQQHKFQLKAHKIKKAQDKKLAKQKEEARRLILEGASLTPKQQKLLSILV